MLEISSVFLTGVALETLSEWSATEKRTRSHLHSTNDSWRVNETYINVKGKWKYLDRAVDYAGNTIDFMLSAKRDKRAAGDVV